MLLQQLLKKYVQQYKLKQLVDVGCFSGWIGRELSTLGVRVHGIDVLPGVLQLANMSSTGSLATFEYLPAQKLGAYYPKHFDGAIVFDTLEHCFNPELVLKNIKRAVVPNGWVFINLPHPQGENEGRRAYQEDFPKDINDLELHEHLFNFNETEIKKLMGKEKNFSCAVINNEKGTINWFIKFQV